MARDIWHFQATVPAGTTQAAPYRQALTIPVRVIDRIDWRLPPGCAGLVGFYISMGKVQVQPQPAGVWVFGDGIHDTWLLDDQPDSGAWEVTAYNSGALPHTIHLTFHASLVESAPKVPVLLDGLALSHYSSQAG